MYVNLKKIDKLNMRNSLRNKNTQATDKIIRTKKKTSR